MPATSTDDSRTHQWAEQQFKSIEQRAKCRRVGWNRDSVATIIEAWEKDCTEDLERLASCENGGIVGDIILMWERAKANNGITFKGGKANG